MGGTGNDPPIEAMGDCPFTQFEPSPHADQLIDWGWYYLDVPLSIAAMLAVSVGIRRIRSPAERRFWRLVVRRL